MVVVAMPTRREALTATFAAAILPSGKPEPPWHKAATNAPDWPAFTLYPVTEEEIAVWTRKGVWDHWISYLVFSRLPDNQVYTSTIFNRPWWLKPDGTREVRDGVELGPKDAQAEARRRNEELGIRIKQCILGFEDRVEKIRARA
jgi:hypothetical protein